MPACGSPKLIAACHVFLRRLLPRHPPCALSSLTTKFTQHTYAVRRFVVRYSQTSFRESANTPNKLYSATLLLARLDMFTCSANCKIPRFARNSHLGKMIHPIKEVLRTPAGTAALIKIYFALYLPNLFSCQSSSSLAALNIRTIQQAPPGRVWEFAISFRIRFKEDQIECYCWSTSNPMFGVKATFFGP